MDDSIIAILQIKNFKNLATIFGYEFSERMLVYISGALKDISEKTGSRVFKLTWHEFGLQIPFNRYGIPSKAVLILTGIVNELSRNKIQWDNKELNPVICAGGVIVKMANTAGRFQRQITPFSCLLRITQERCAA
jgi:GGDEF domain-containing protein